MERVQNYDYEPRYDYQGEETEDPFIGENQRDDPTRLFGVPADELAKELDDLAIDEDLLHENEVGYDDAIARIEDLDEDGPALNKAM